MAAKSNIDCRSADAAVLVNNQFDVFHRRRAVAGKMFAEKLSS